MKRYHSLFMGLAVAAVAGLAGGAHAAVITYTAVTNPFTIGFGSTPTEINTNVTAPQWNATAFPAGSVLISADVTITVDITGSVKLTNNGFSRQTASAAVTSTGTFTGFTPFTFSFASGSQSLAGGGSTTFPYSGTQTIDSGLLTGSALSTYLGSGAVTFPYQTLTSLSLQGSGGQIAAVQTTAEDATLVVTYTYDTGSGFPSVPEPASLGLLGAGSVLLLLRRKRR